MAGQWRAVLIITTDDPDTTGDDVSNIVNNAAAMVRESYPGDWWADVDELEPMDET